MSIIPVLGRLKQKDHDFKASVQSLSQKREFKVSSWVILKITFFLIFKITQLDVGHIDG
jgi:hypothetical protein